MVLIFFLSAQTAQQSTEQSSAVVDFLNSIFSSGATNFIVRKSAHFLEFALLAFLFGFALFCNSARAVFIKAVALTSAYAATDEIHQLFVAGRSCQITDWLIDSAGAAAGAAAFIAAAFILSRLKKKRKTD